MPKKIATNDLERVKLLNIVSKRGLKDLSLKQLKRLLLLVEKKKTIATTKKPVNQK